MTDEELRDKLLEFREIDPVTDCWNWKGPLDKDGYGVVEIEGKWHRVDKLMLQLVQRRGRNFVK